MDNTAQKTILVIEDEEPLRHALTSKLKDEEMEVLEAENGEDGMTLALDRHPDLIVVDLLMPKMDGIEFLDALERDEWGKNAKVIILSNLSKQEVVNRAQVLRNHPYFEKSRLELDEFYSTVKKLLDPHAAENSVSSS